MIVDYYDKNHPLRCETCKHRNKEGALNQDCDLLDHWLTEREVKFVGKVGCASHSNFKEGQVK